MPHVKLSEHRRAATIRPSQGEWGAKSARAAPQNGQNTMIAGIPTTSTIASSGNPMRQ